MTSLPAALVRYRTDLEQAIARDQRVRIRRSKRRRRMSVLLAAAIVVVGTASALAAARELFSVDPVARGRISRAVDSVRFSFTVPSPKANRLDLYWYPWENGPKVKVDQKFRTRSMLISKSIVGGQAAEAVVFWTAFPDGGEAALCSALLPDVGRSTADLGAAMARAPGTKLVQRPTPATVGGRPATQLVLKVRKDLGCDPGYLFSWHPRTPEGECWGACWLEARVGDTIRVWIVDVAGKRLVIQAETRHRGHPEVSNVPGPVARDHRRIYSAEFKKVEREITEIVGSIRFD